MANDNDEEVPPASASPSPLDLRSRRPSLPNGPRPAEEARRRVATMRDQLLADLDRWEPELVDWLGGRGTLWYGIFDKACKGVDSLISAMTCQALLCAPDPGAAVLLLVGQGKPVERLTLGQQLDVLRALNKRRLLTAGRQVPKIDLDRIESLVDKRNDFEHGREL